MDKVVIIGISGVTCGGKTTLALKLKSVLPGSIVISQDNYFLPVEDPRHIWIRKLNHINFDILSSLDMEKMQQDIEELIRDKDRIKISTNGITLQKNIISSLQAQIEAEGVCVVIVEGFSVFNYKPLVPLFDLKYYFTLSERDCFERRKSRIYEPPDCPGYFEECAWPEHLKQLQEVKNEVKGVHYFDGFSKSADVVLRDLHNICHN